MELADNTTAMRMAVLSGIRIAFGTTVKDDDFENYIKLLRSEGR